MADKLTYGSYYFDTAASTTLSAATPAKAAGTTAPMAAYGLTTTTSNRITLNAGQTTRLYDVNVSISSTKALGGDAIGSFYIYKNGVEIPGMHIQRTIANSSDIGAIPINGQVELSEGDYLELWVESDNGNAIQIEHGVVSVKVLG